MNRIYLERVGGAIISIKLIISVKFLGVAT